MATVFRIALAALVLLLAAVALLLSSDRALFATAGFLVEKLTNYRLVLDGPSLDLRRGLLAADSIRLYQRNLDGPPLLAAEGVELRNATPLLRRGHLRGTDLRAGSVLAWVDRSDSTEDPDPEDWLQQTRWLPRTLEIGVLHVVTRGTEVHILPVKNLDGRWHPDGHFALAGAADYRGEPLDFGLELYQPSGAELRLVGRLEAPESGSLVSLEGDLEASGAELRYRLAIDADYHRVEAFLRALEDDAYGFAGGLTLSGELRGDLLSATLTIEELILDNSPRFRSRAVGKLEWSRDAPVEIELVASARLADAAPLTELLGTDLTALGRIDASGSLGGTLAEPVISKLELNTLSGSGVEISLLPRQPFPLRGGVPENFALDATVSGPDLTALAPWVALPPLAAGPWTASGTLTRGEQGLRASDLEAELRDLPGGGTLQASGDIAVISTAAEKGPLFRGLDLAVDVRGLDPAPLLAAIDVDATLPGAAVISGTARLAGDEGALGVTGIDASVAALGGELRLRGTLASLAPFGGVDLTVQPRSIAVEALADAIPGLHDLAPGDARLDGSARLLDGDGQWSVVDIDLALTGWPPLELSLSGAARDLLGEPRAQLEARYTVRRPPQPLRFSVPPGEGTAVLDLAPRRHLLGLHALLGESDITAIFEVNRDENGISGFRGEVDFPKLHLPDIVGIQGENALDADDSDGEPVQAGGGSLLDKLPAYPVKLRLNIDEISGTDIAASDFAILATGQGRRLTLERFDVAYSGGTVQLRGVADFSGDTARASLAGLALGLPLTNIGANLGFGGEIEGTVSVRGGMTMQGDSRDDLVASLNGSLAAAVVDGYVEGAAFDLLMTDLVSWLLMGGILQNNTSFECGMADFRFTDGVARSDSLFLATKNMIATGKATFDFPASRVDIRIDPRARSRTVQIPSSVRIRGPMESPSIIPSPITATFDASARLLFLVPELGMKLLGIDLTRDDDLQPCAAVLKNR